MAGGVLKDAEKLFKFVVTMWILNVVGAFFAGYIIAQSIDGTLSSSFLAKLENKIVYTVSNWFDGKR